VQLGEFGVDEEQIVDVSARSTYSSTLLERRQRPSCVAGTVMVDAQRTQQSDALSTAQLARLKEERGDDRDSAFVRSDLIDQSTREQRERDAMPERTLHVDRFLEQVDRVVMRAAGTQLLRSGLQQRT
jgi:hypothetical protein